MHPGAKPSHYSCTLVRHVPTPPATACREVSPPHPPEPRAEDSRPPRATGRSVASGRPGGELCRTAGLHPQPSRAGPWDQPLNPPPATPLRRSRSTSSSESRPSDGARHNHDSSPRQEDADLPCLRRSRSASTANAPQARASARSPRTSMLTGFRRRTGERGGGHQPSGKSCVASILDSSA
jgi:hypothetical protein